MQSGTISEEDEAVQIKQPSITMTDVDADADAVMNPLSNDTDVTDVTKALFHFIASRFENVLS